MAKPKIKNSDAPQSKKDEKIVEEASPERFSGWTAIILVLLGIAACQAVLYGSSLVGSTTMLPIDFLASPGVYIPQTPDKPKVVPHNHVLSDLVLLGEPCRLFAVSEIRAGRWPLWNPCEFAGCPFPAYSKYSPLSILNMLIESPTVISWTEALLAVFVGFGAYLFCRHALHVGLWPSVIVAWCWPLTGYFVLWHEYGLTFVVSWLPWLLLAVDRAVRRRNRWSCPAVAGATCLTLVSGQLDVSGQVLLTSGLYAVWCFIDEFGKQCFSRRAAPAAATLVLGWTFGFLLAAPYILPVLEYSRTGSRMERRAKGEEERPPVGIAALPQTVLPDMYGSTQQGSFPMFPKGQGNLLESSAATYAGLLTTFFLAPLAWCSRRRLSINIFWIVLGFIGLCWCLNVPVIVDLMRLPGLNMMSYNRFVFAASFAILALAAVGLEVLWKGELSWRWWFWIPIALLAGLTAWCCYRAIVLPEPIATQLGGMNFEFAVIQKIQSNFARNYAVAAMFCCLAAAGWGLVWFRVNWRPWLFGALAFCLLADLVWFAYGRTAQCDPALYYPRIPALAQVAKATPGRVIGVQCLPAALAQTHQLHDIRGYDAVDPSRFIALMLIAADQRSSLIPYALTQWMLPKIAATPSGAIRLSPVLDMLNVCYVIFRGSPPPGIRPDFSSPDYWVMINGNALPRVYVPERVETVADDRKRLEKIAAPNFNARQVAYVEQPLSLPDVCRGSAEIVGEIPTRVTVSCKMETPGLVVLADLWDAGWNAYYDGNPVPVLRTNHAIRGVVLPAGSGILEFRYEPVSFTWGVRFFGLAVAFLIGWVGFYGRRFAKNP